METETFQSQALEVNWPDENFNPNSEPQDGLEFLTKVVYERLQCPSVVCKPLQEQQQKSTDYHDILNGIEDENHVGVCPENLRPSHAWKKTQLHDFSRIRDKIANAKMKLTEFKLISEANLCTDFSQFDSYQWKKFCSSNQPYLLLMFSIQQRPLERLVEFQAEWLSDALEEFNKSDPMEAWQGQWLYASLACIQLPLEAFVHGNLRIIARNCITMRNQLEITDEKNATPFNLIAVIITEYFRQLDLRKMV